MIINACSSARLELGDFIRLQFYPVYPVCRINRVMQTLPYVRFLLMYCSVASADYCLRCVDRRASFEVLQLQEGIGIH
jgi:hypothetical protein